MGQPFLKSYRTRKPSEQCTVGKISQFSDMKWNNALFSEFIRNTAHVFLVTHFSNVQKYVCHFFGPYFILDNEVVVQVHDVSYFGNYQNPASQIHWVDELLNGSLPFQRTVDLNRSWYPSVPSLSARIFG